MWFSFLWNMMRVRRRWMRREKRRWKLEVTESIRRKQMEGELEDERIAMFLQNEEFMAELRWNKDFLSMLDKGGYAGFLMHG
ncbi:Cuedc1p [Homalodisca vitripennis]|nr:Cuedc1p [Homalodisca vitripennis]